MGIVPVVAALLAYFVLREHIGTLTVVAVVLCSIGIVLYNVGDRLMPARKR